MRPRTRINGKLVPLAIEEHTMQAILFKESKRLLKDGLTVCEAEDERLSVHAWHFAGGECVGVIRADRDHFEKYYVVWHLIVKKEYQRQGIATELYRSLAAKFDIRHSRSLTEDGKEFVASLNRELGPA